MILKINYQSTIPIYQQVIDEIKLLIKKEELHKGDSLPSIRKMAGQLDVSVNTIARAYQELERLGMIETGGRRGTFIKGIITEEGGADTREFKKTIRELFLAGRKQEEIRGLFEEALNEIFD